jgi:predicted RNase H-like HicB family nuclease
MLWHAEETEIVFKVVRELDGGFVADCLKEEIITQSDTWEELRNNVREAVDAFFFVSLILLLRRKSGFI